LGELKNRQKRGKISQVKMTPPPQFSANPPSSNNLKQMPQLPTANPPTSVNIAGMFQSGYWLPTQKPDPFMSAQ